MFENHSWSKCFVRSVIVAFAQFVGHSFVPPSGVVSAVYYRSLEIKQCTMIRWINNKNWSYFEQTMQGQRQVFRGGGPCQVVVDLLPLSPPHPFIHSKKLKFAWISLVILLELGGGSEPLDLLSAAVPEPINQNTLTVSPLVKIMQ